MNSTKSWPHHVLHSGGNAIALIVYLIHNRLLDRLEDPTYFAGCEVRGIWYPRWGYAKKYGIIYPAEVRQKDLIDRGDTKLFLSDPDPVEFDVIAYVIEYCSMGANEIFWHYYRYDVGHFVGVHRLA